MRTGISELAAGGMLLAALLACKKDEQPAGSTGAAPAPAGPDLAGSYDITTGTNPDGSNYKGTVALTKQDAFYRLSWNAGGATYAGVGVQQGNVLGVGWGESEPYGVAVYAVSGGKLTGTWATSKASGKLGTEVLEGPAGLSGTYEIVDSLSPETGSKYEGKVVITPQGETYDVKWNLANEQYQGVGLMKNNVFVASFPAGAGVVAYDVTSSGLSGRWAQKPGGGVGTEVVAKK